MTTSESKGRFFLLNESIRIDSHNESNRIDSNRELECSNMHISAIPAVQKKYRTFCRTSEKIQDMTGLQKPILLHLLGIIVYWQYSKSSDVGSQ